jgi:hypothetical protein
MWNPSTNRLILNDWDLSVHRTPKTQGATGTDRTATIPFMALDLLTGKYDGSAIRLCRHDLEALVWTFTWLTVDRETGPGVQLKQWLTTNARQCSRLKKEFTEEPAGDENNPFLEASAPWSECLTLMIDWVIDIITTRVQRGYTMLNRYRPSTEVQTSPERTELVWWGVVVAAFDKAKVATWKNRPTNVESLAQLVTQPTKKREIGEL